MIYNFKERIKRSENVILKMMSLALIKSRHSRDPKTKVGCVITNAKNEIMSTGYNGFPKKVFDCTEKLDSSDKNPLMVHAEMNAILQTNVDLTGSVLYTTHFPCRDCLKHIAVVEPESIYFIEDFYTSSEVKYTCDQITKKRDDSVKNFNHLEVIALSFNDVRNFMLKNINDITVDYNERISLLPQPLPPSSQLGFAA